MFIENLAYRVEIQISKTTLELLALTTKIGAMPPDPDLAFKPFSNKRNQGSLEKWLILGQGARDGGKYYKLSPEFLVAPESTEKDEPCQKDTGANPKEVPMV